MNKHSKGNSCGTKNNLGFFNGVLDEIFEGIENSFGKDVLPLRNVPRANIHETDKSFILEIAAPGYTKKDFSVKLEKDTLVVSGERKEDNENESFRKREFRYGSFKRHFALPELADRTDISASYRNGILSIAIGKTQAAKEEGRTIDIS